MVQQVHLCGRFVTVLGYSETVNVITVTTIKLVVEIGKKSVQQCAAGIRATIERWFCHEGLVVLVIPPVQTQVQAVLRSFEQTVFVDEGP
ncbi:hypothetical protein [Sedimentitalea todarodis]|uniref:Uncharacterized protein n=1 Tax=Sedimentitalea todarodis TaxID=1631240 RepID=A0ABU3VIN2_9RHOB|nr:hypothetical protein [Sedimentitalea todarodis]MDU9006005.1 hypothetical protein [Sedimentitalea todarodis]